LRRSADLLGHEVLIDIEWAGAENFDRAEDRFEKGDALFDIGHRNADMVHAVDFVCHVLPPFGKRTVPA